MSKSSLMFITECSAVAPGDLALREVTGREAMSRLYEYELTFEVNQDGGLAPEVIDGLFSRRSTHGTSPP